MKKNRSEAFTLVETLAALCVTMCVVPVALSAFGSVFLIGLRLGGHMDRVSLAEWWFNRLEHSPSFAALAAMPRTDAGGKIHFSWDAKEAEDGSLCVTLRVAGGAGSDVPFVIRRVY